MPARVRLSLLWKHVKHAKTACRASYSACERDYCPPPPSKCARHQQRNCIRSKHKTTQKKQKAKNKTTEKKTDAGLLLRASHTREQRQRTVRCRKCIGCRLDRPSAWLLAPLHDCTVPRIRPLSLRHHLDPLRFVPLVLYVWCCVCVLCVCVCLFVLCVCACCVCVCLCVCVCVCCVCVVDTTSGTQ